MLQAVPTVPIRVGEGWNNTPCPYSFLQDTQGLTPAAGCDSHQPADLAHSTGSPKHPFPAYTGRKPPNMGIMRKLGFKEPQELAKAQKSPELQVLALTCLAH